MSNKPIPNAEDAELQEIYDRFFQLMAELCVEHPAQMVTGTMMAIALRLYKTTLTTEDFNKMIQTMHDTAHSIEPFMDMPLKTLSKKLH